MAEQPVGDGSGDSLSLPPVAEQPILPAWLEPPQEESDNPYWVSGQLGSLTPAQRSSSVGLLVVAIVIVSIGLIAVLPGLGILMAILVVPPLIRTVVIAQHRAAHHRPSSTSEQILLFVGSFGVTLVVSLVVLVSTFGTFCFVCLTAGTEKAIPVAMFSAGVATLATCVPLFFWSRHRWRRHTNVS